MSRVEVVAWLCPFEGDAKNAMRWKKIGGWNLPLITLTDHERAMAEAVQLLSDLKWRIDDIRDNLMKRNGRDESIYGIDEWSTPAVNLSLASDKAEAFLKNTSYRRVVFYPTGQWPPSLQPHLPVID